MISAYDWEERHAYQVVPNADLRYGKTLEYNTVKIDFNRNQ